MKTVLLLFFALRSFCFGQIGLNTPLLTLFNAPISTTPAVTLPTPLARYYFDGNANDAEGNFNGVAVGVPTYVLSENGTTANGAISFNGTSQWVTTTLTPSTSLTGNWTINFWMYSTASSAAADMVYSSVVSGSSRFYLNAPDSTGLGNWKLGLSSWNPVIAGLQQNVWIMVTVELNGTTGTILTNNVIAAQQTGITVSEGGAWLYIGASVDGNQFPGNVDDFQVFTNALTYGPNSQVGTLLSNKAQQ